MQFTVLVLQSCVLIDEILVLSMELVELISQSVDLRVVLTPTSSGGFPPIASLKSAPSGKCEDFELPTTTVGEVNLVFCNRIRFLSCFCLDPIPVVDSIHEISPGFLVKSGYSSPL